MAFGIDDAIAGVTGVINRVIDRAIPDPAQAAAAKLEVLKEANQQEIREKTSDLTAIMAEASSSDKWTSRARPGFLYVMYVMILAALPVGVLSIFAPDAAAHLAAGMQAFLHAIPSEMWSLFGFGYGGYVLARGSDKAGGLVPFVTGKKS